MQVILTLSKQSLPSFFSSLHVLFVIFIAFLKAFFFLSHLSVGLSFFPSPFFPYNSVSLYSISINFSFLLPTFFHSLFPSFSFLLCFFLMYTHTHTHTHTHMYITHRYTDLTPLLHNDAPLYPLRNTAYLSGWMYQTSPSGEIT
jgi:hypothetical protein